MLRLLVRRESSEQPSAPSDVKAEAEAGKKFKASAVYSQEGGHSAEMQFLVGKVRFTYQVIWSTRGGETN